MTKAKTFYDTAKTEGFVMEGDHDYEGIYNADFIPFLLENGFSCTGTKEESDSFADRVVHTYEKGGVKVIVRHITHEDGRKSSWRLTQS